MNKTKPIGVRFDPEKLEFVKTREKLKSNQQVVDFLMNKYWWEWKLPHVTAKESPPLSLKIQSAVSPHFENRPVKAPKTMQQYFEEKRECQCVEDWKALEADIDADPLLSTKQKQLLKTTNQ